jgi:hypothetical protein
LDVRTRKKVPKFVVKETSQVYTVIDVRLYLRVRTRGGVISDRIRPCNAPMLFGQRAAGPFNPEATSAFFVPSSVPRGRSELERGANMAGKLSESGVVKMEPKKGWRISATIKDKDFEFAIKHRLVDDEISQEQLVIEGIHLYLAQKPKRFVPNK